MPRALISVSDKTGLVDFARGLAARGVELVSTGGTAKALQAAGLAVLNISDVTGFPEMMDGRVKTLHPLVHGGILARRSDPGHMAAAAAHGITMIDLVVVNLYPFVAAAARPDTPFEGLIEEIDIGGPSLVRGAAKNFQDVLVVVAPADYAEVLRQLDQPGGPSMAFRFDLARKAFAHTGAYDTAIASTLATVTAGTGGFVRGAAPLAPDALTLGLRKVRDLRYGENPHQAAAWYAEEPAAGLGAAEILQGKELSYTNLLDLDAAARIVLEFSEPAAAVIKHTNPCGASTGASAADAYVRAREADSLAAFGGIVGLNRAIDVDAARAIVSTFIEAVIAPGVSDEARAILAQHARRGRGFLAPGCGAWPRRPVDSRCGAGADARPCRGGGGAVAGRGPPRRHEAPPDRRRVAGAALRLARLRAREVEHRDLHHRRPDLGDWGRADESRRRRPGCADEGGSRRP
jgi:phosphoribosylaminoimidazolecarboxamide formyltransferase/IMP cyclohydrolase